MDLIPIIIKILSLGSILLVLFLIISYVYTKLNKQKDDNYFKQSISQNSNKIIRSNNSKEKEFIFYDNHLQQPQIVSNQKDKKSNRYTILNESNN